MSRLYHRVLLLFVDGVGLTETSPSNPFSTVETPAFERLLGGPLTRQQLQVGDEVVLTGLDATLDIEGLPQSATGQASLFTGRNGARILGRHQTGLPGPQMRQLVADHGLFLRARRAGLSATFANAYSEAYLQELEEGVRKPSVTTTAVRAAGLEFRRIPELELGQAVTWDLCRDLAGQRSGVRLKVIEAHLAGTHLASIARAHDLTVFESFVTDLAGHLKRGVEPAEAVRRLDAAIGGIEEQKSAELTWVLTSDHGNVEDVSAAGHTRNPVPLLAVGPAARAFSQASSILDVSAIILDVLEASS